jgi:hypothetical protein
MGGGAERSDQLDGGTREMKMIGLIGDIISESTLFA